MNPPVTLSERFEVAVGKKTVSTLQKSPERRTVLIATADAEMREALEGLLEASRVNAIFQQGKEAYGGSAWSTQIVKLLEDAVGADLRAPGFPAKLEI